MHPDSGMHVVDPLRRLERGKKRDEKELTLVLSTNVLKSVTDNAEGY